ncbi:sigma factor-binding protein Crl [Vibrio renipiscarius]|uniref:Sigma factor-binding protein Crl n=1 Tax=Vibrio renipiscarius TaxID=1461322 RepID=A0A0C2JWP5_9VIBR|nr:sigma factor-binding protein Crl [Vibrio renipiscarius]KII80380.1 XRE family transcriptional regulator [Vibrio renipiscarius]KII82359.1 XRE family transcriptional regulator [Vibrio renipiscarius]
MSKVTKIPTHFRLLTSLRAIGPYLRESQSREGFYLFDCLGVCVDDKKSPEEREFWGWWLELEMQGQEFAARYRVGKYDKLGEWVNDPLPKEAVAEVNRIQNNFHQKLVEVLEKEFGVLVTLHDKSVEFV